METIKAFDASTQSRNEADQEFPIDKPEFLTNSVLDSEVEKFTELSKGWWSQPKVYILLSMNRIRVPYVVEKVKETGIIRGEFADTATPLKGLKILDVGCGGGFYSEALAKHGADVVGIDASEEMIKIAKDHQALDETLTNLEYKYTTVEELALAHAEAFDVVVCSEVVEHINNPRSFVAECAKCLKFGGSLIMTTINKTFWSRFFIIYLCENVFGIIPKGTHDLEMFISPEDLSDMLAAGGCETTEIRGIGINPFTSNWFWSPTTKGNYSIHATKTKISNN